MELFGQINYNSLVMYADLANEILKFYDPVENTQRETMKLIVNRIKTCPRALWELADIPKEWAGGLRRHCVEKDDDDMRDKTDVITDDTDEEDSDAPEEEEIFNVITDDMRDEDNYEFEDYGYISN